MNGKIIFTFFMIGLILSCSEPAPTTIKIVRNISKTNPDSYCPISNESNYYYSYRIIDDFYAEDYIENSNESLIDIGNMKWIKLDEQKKNILSTTTSKTYELKSNKLLKFPTYITEINGKPKVSFIQTNYGLIEYDILSSPIIPKINVLGIDFYNVIKVSDSFTDGDINQKRDYYFAKGIGLIKYDIVHTEYIPSKGRSYQTRVFCQIDEYDIK